MIIGRGWAYVCPQKTGTASVRTWLRARHQGRQHGKYHGRALPPDAASALVFMTVRDPYERLYSLWNVRNGRAGPGVTQTPRQPRDLPFEECCAHYAAIGGRLVDFRDATGATVVLRCEHLAEDIRRLPFVADDDPGPGHLRHNDGKVAARLADHFGEEGRALVRRYFAADFEAFGYEP